MFLTLETVTQSAKQVHSLDRFLELSHVGSYKTFIKLNIIFFCACVAVLFLEHWKRRQISLSFSWDLTGIEEDEVATVCTHTHSYVHTRKPTHVDTCEWINIKTQLQHQCLAAAVC